jgi:hypothetical protein
MQIDMKTETLEEAADEYACNSFVWPLNKQGEKQSIPLGQIVPPGYAKHQKVVTKHFIEGAKWQQENSYSDKKEFAISFSRFLELLKINHPELYWSKNVDELIEIYQDENRG